jgi:hypothetical protein
MDAATMIAGILLGIAICVLFGLALDGDMSVWITAGNAIGVSLGLALVGWRRHRC